MSADKLSSLLMWLCVFVSGAMIVVLLAARQSLKSAAHGTAAWAIGDLNHALARAVLIGSLSPAFIDAWETHIGHWQPYHLTTMLILVGWWCHFMALRQLSGNTALQVKASHLVYLVLAVLAVTFAADVATVAERKVLALLIIAACSGVVIRMAWPLAHRFWGARLMVLNAGLAIACVTGRMWSAFTGENGLAAIADVAEQKEYIGEVIYGLASTMAFILIQQERLRERIVQIGVTDALTGAYNRNGFLPLFERELRASRRAGLPMSVVLFDLDHFKRINDGHGHAAGDAVLRAVTSIIKASIRPRDTLCRWGGEEFLLMLPEQHGEATTLVARRISKALRDNPIVVEGGGPLAVTVSAGVATLDGILELPDQMATLLDPLVADADRRLYQAKTRRDCVVSHQGEFAPPLAPEESVYAFNRVASNSVLQLVR